MHMLLEEACRRCPMIAILRGVIPHEVEGVADALINAGFSIIEVPLNSPEAIDSIERLVTKFGDMALIGAGTVLKTSDVADVVRVGGRLIVAPNANPDVITASVAAGAVTLPGYATPTEAFAALNAGAHGLKLFPAEAASVATLRAHRAVLPPAVPIFVVGGITPDTMGQWVQAGASGFGLGSALFRPGMTHNEVSVRAMAFVAALDACPVPSSTASAGL